MCGFKMDNSTKFLSKDRETALVEVKEILYQRKELVERCLLHAMQDDFGYVSLVDGVRASELNFLNDLLDIIERS